MPKQGSYKNYITYYDIYDFSTFQGLSSGTAFRP